MFPPTLSQNLPIINSPSISVCGIDGVFDFTTSEFGRDDLVELFFILWLQYSHEEAKDVNAFPNDGIKVLLTFFVDTNQHKAS